MECTISYPDKKVKQLLGDISEAEFAEFCKDAILKALFEAQLLQTGTRCHVTWLKIKESEAFIRPT